MNEVFLVVDSEFNQTWNKELIGLKFKEPPSYIGVQKVVGQPDYESFESFSRNKKEGCLSEYYI